MVEDGNGQTCLGTVRPGRRSVDQSEQHDFRLQYPRPGSTPSDEIQKRSSGYACQWGGTDLLGGHGVRPDEHLQLPWGYLRHGQFER